MTCETNSSPSEIGGARLSDRRETRLKVGNRPTTEGEGHPICGAVISVLARTSTYARSRLAKLACHAKYLSRSFV